MTTSPSSTQNNLMTLKRFLLLLVLAMAILAVWQVLATVLLSFGTPFWLVAVTFVPAVVSWVVVTRMTKRRV